MKTKPFNVQQYIAGKPAVDKYGNESIYKFTLQRTSQGSIHIGLKSYNGRDFFTHVDDYGHSYTPNFDRVRENDLFMKCEEKEYWIATGVSLFNNDKYSSALEINEQYAIDNLRRSISLDESTLQTHKIIRYE